MYRKLIGIRNEKGYTQADIAKMLGIATKTYCYKERGETEFTVSEAKKIMILLKKSFEELFC